VGREAHLERLEQLWKEAAAGELRVALVAGEPGVGKTRLAAELAARVHEEGATVLAGRCDEDLGVPYQPFVEALRQFVDHMPRLNFPANSAVSAASWADSSPSCPNGSRGCHPRCTPTRRPSAIAFSTPWPPG